MPAVGTAPSRVLPLALRLDRLFRLHAHVLPRFAPVDDVVVVVVADCPVEAAAALMLAVTGGFSPFFFDSGAFAIASGLPRIVSVSMLTKCCSLR